MKKCCKCQEPFDTPGIQCVPCRDAVTAKRPNALPELTGDMTMALPLMLYSALTRKRKRAIRKEVVEATEQEVNRREK